MLIPILLCVTFIIFTLMDLAPGTIIDSMITEDMTPQDIEFLRAKYDLDKPMVVRYGKYIWNLLHGDLGSSQITGLSVWEQFSARWPNTLWLSVFSLMFGVALAIPAGLFAAKYAGSIWDNITTALAMVGLSMPNFWLGLMLLTWFSLKLKIFPAAYDGTWRSFVLPISANGLAMMASITRQTRSSVLEVSRQDFLRTARAKGVPERQVTLRHKLGNAWIPIITQIGMMLGITLGGSAVIETVYSWPGVGYLMVEAISRRDTTMACGCVILTASMYSTVLLLVDLVYAAIDPRIRSAYSSKKKRRTTT
jgi:peptide/nickel transport system permease protein